MTRPWGHKSVARPGLVVATRYWGTTHDDLNRLLIFAERVLTAYLPECLIIAVNSAADKTQGALRLREAFPSCPGLHILEIAPWGAVTNSLNTILQFVVDNRDVDCTRLLFASPEVEASPEQLDILAGTLTAETLVAGFALDGHALPNDSQVVTLRGDTSPWNTFAVWSFKQLAETRFSEAGDHLDPPGLEDMATILLHKMAHGDRRRLAKLVAIRSDLDSVQWRTEHRLDRQRQDYQARKMESKQRRGQCILQTMKVCDATVDVLYI